MPSWSLFGGRSASSAAPAFDSDVEEEEADLHAGIEMDDDLADNGEEAEVDQHGRLREIRPERGGIDAYCCRSNQSSGAILRGLLWMLVLLVAASGWIAYASVRNTNNMQTGADATAIARIACNTETELVGTDQRSVTADAHAAGDAAAKGEKPADPSSAVPLVSPDVPPPWLPPDSPLHPIPNQFASRQIHGDRQVSNRINVTMHAFPSFTCDNYYRHTYEFASWPDDVQGRKLSQSEWAENPHIPRGHHLVDGRYIRMPFVHHAAQTPYYWHIDARKEPITVFGQGTIATSNNDGSWMGPGVCRAGGFDNQDWGYFGTSPADRHTPRIQRGVVLTQLYSHGYYHFLGETFTRLANVPLEILQDKSWSIILDYPPARSTHDMIRCFDLGDRMVSTEQSPVVVERELIVPQPAVCDIGHPMILARFQRAIWGCHAAKDEGFRKIYGERYDPYRNNWLRPLPVESQGDSESKTPVPHRYRVPSQKRFTPRVPLRKDPASGSPSDPLLDIHSVLFMHRETRRVGDEDALLKVVRSLLPNATLALHKGDESFAETARLFADAELIIGPHGAGFTNQLWSLPGAIAVELMSMGHTERMYHHHAEVYGLRHYFITHPAEGMAPEEFEKALRRILGQSAQARLQDIEEGIRRRVKLDTTCVTEAEEHLNSEGVVTTGVF